MQAVIMAGGKGTRLGVLTRDIPKPMVPINGKPILLHQIENLRENGILDINPLSTTYHILKNMRRCGVKRLFFASSSAIYGEKTDVILTEETGPLMPVSYLLLWRGKTGLGGVDLRLLPPCRALVLCFDPAFSSAPLL